MLTGLNEAFIVDNATREALIAQDPASADLLKPILRGRDIKRYRADWKELWLIATMPSLHVNIDNYTAIKKHLLSFSKDRLEQSGMQLSNGGKSRKKTPHQWFELQDACAYYKEFMRDKLVWIELVGNARFAYDDSSTFCEATSFVMTGPCLKYLCALLNSSLIQYFFQQIAPTSGTGTLRWKKVYVERIPIPKISAAQQKPFIELTDGILQAKATNPAADTSALEVDIDRLVYQLYGLTTEEIAVVERSSPSSGGGAL